MRSKIQIKRLEGKKLDICRIFEGLFIEWKSLLHLGPTISLLKGGYGEAIFCFKVILGLCQGSFASLAPLSLRKTRGYANVP